MSHDVCQHFFEKETAEAQNAPLQLRIIIHWLSDSEPYRYPVSCGSGISLPDRKRYIPLAEDSFMFSFIDDTHLFYAVIEGDEIVGYSLDASTVP